MVLKWLLEIWKKLWSSTLTKNSTMSMAHSERRDQMVQKNRRAGGDVLYKIENPSANHVSLKGPLSTPFMRVIKNTLMRRSPA